MSGVERLLNADGNATFFGSYINMDLLHRPNEFNFISDEINIREFFEVALKSQESFYEDVDKRKTQFQSDDEWFASLTGCDVSVAQEIAHVCE
uniref:Uncharacterized protein n=1 Tax=Romanomermis culicivorax TaxID=13658 RepID=A0A915IIL4_ROMCU